MTPAHASLAAAEAADLTTLPARCGPLDRFLVERLSACERIADRVAALGDMWGPVVGSEPFVVAWSVLHGLARAGQARACGCRP